MVANSKKYDVIIVGAGTAGLSARKEVAKKTSNYLVVDDGPLGTTCARVGCMPSKVLIQVANDFHRRIKLAKQGIQGGESLSVDDTKIMSHVRSLRDRFVNSVKSPMADWEDKLIRKKARFISANSIDVGGELFTAEKFILAVGSRPIVPGPWVEYKDHLIDTNEFFELERLPNKLAVIGLGVIGFELGQAINRLGVETVGITLGRSIGGASDPEIQESIIKNFSHEMPLYFNGAQIKGIEHNQIRVEADGKVFSVDKGLIALGRRSNFDLLGVEKIGMKLNEHGLPKTSMNTLSVEGFEHIFVPGDANGDRPILHEAADEGTIAGFNSVNDTQCFKRRTSLGITFSDPNIGVVGESYASLTDRKANFKIGRVSFEGQGRSIVKAKEIGALHIYADSRSTKILGAELFAPDGEHLAHLIAWAISLELTVFEALRLPFYHPVIEEGLRTALRDCAAQLKPVDHNQELFRCNDAPIR